MGMGLGRSLIASALLLGLSANISAAPQDELVDTFREGVRLINAKRDQEALEKFKAILSEDLSNEQAFRLWQQTEERVWMRLLMKRGEFAKIAKALILKAKVERKERMADADAIKALVQESLSNDFSTRMKASHKLRQDHGEYAVPALLNALGDADNEDGQIFAQRVLVELGPMATLPLLEALASDNALLRRNIVTTLREIGDARAIPEMKLLAKDKNSMVRLVAAKALAKLGGASKSAEELLLARATGFRNGEGLEESEEGNLVWSWKKGKLSFTKIPKIAFPYEIARQSAYKALAASPEFAAAKVEVVMSYLAERATVNDAMAAGNAELAGLSNSLLSSDVVIAATGLKVVREATVKAIATNQPSLCSEAFKALAHLENMGTVKNSPLNGATKHSNTEIRTQAAMAVASLGTKDGNAITAEAATLLAETVNNRLVRLIQTIGLEGKAKSVISEASASKANMTVVESSSGASGIRRAFEYPADIFVVNFDLSDNLTAMQVVNMLRKNPKTAGKKILIIAKSLKKAEAEVDGDKVDGFIAMTAAKNLVEKVFSTLEGFKVNVNREKAVLMAIDAAKTLAKLDAKSLQVPGMEGKLRLALDHEENDVVLNVLVAVGTIGTADSVDSIGEVITSARPDNVRIAAAKALGSILGRGVEASTELINKLTALVGSEASLELRTAIAGALSKAGLSDAKRIELLKLLRS